MAAKNHGASLFLPPTAAAAWSVTKATSLEEVDRALWLMQRATAREPYPEPEPTIAPSLIPVGSLRSGTPLDNRPITLSAFRPRNPTPRFGHPAGYVPWSGTYL